MQVGAICSKRSLQIRNSKFGKILFFTEFEKEHSGSEFEEQNSAVRLNIRQHSPTSTSEYTLHATYNYFNEHGLMLLLHFWIVVKLLIG